MRKLVSLVLGVMVVAAIFAAGMVVSSFQERDAVAEEAGQWSMIVSQYRCDECYAEWGSTEGVPLEDLAERGDPDGDMALSINVIAKLDRDGCEWDWQVLADGVATMIIYRC
jgi:hypothetical protein